MYSRPTTTQLNLSRRFTFVSTSFLHLQECLEAPGPVTACNSRPTPIGQTCRDVSVWFLCFTSTNFPSNFFRYFYQKLLSSHTHTHNTPQVHWQSAPSLYLQTQPYYTKAQLTQEHLDRNKTSTPLKLFLRYQETKLVKTANLSTSSTPIPAEDQGAQYNDSRLHLSRCP